MYTYGSATRRRGVPRVFFLLLGAATFLIFISWLIRKPSSGVISPIPDEPKQAQSVVAAIFDKKKSPDELGLAIQKLVNNRWVNYSVYVEDWNSSFSLGINDTVIYTAASVNKLPILTTLYYKAQKGEIDLDRIITIQEKDIQDYGTGSIRYDTPGATYSIKTLAKLMTAQSDNTAAYILANHIVGIEEIQKLVDSWGLTQTDMANNKTSNRDMSILLKKLYKREVAGEAYTLEMLSFLKDTDFEERLPALLPDSATVYHKIGTEIGVLHDIGIVRDGTLTYYIGILTTDVNDEEEAQSIAAQISKTVYDYLKQ
ncbi:serine hydrolase [Candidatus Gottesmanbacteria bacterium]|nr:serine hydrolase [Candidatus Gottesmanbacteria bacterium]